MAVKDQQITFPLVFMQPVVDVRGMCTALSLHFSPVEQHCDASQVVERLFREYQLLAKIGSVPCIIWVSDPANFRPELQGNLYAARIILRIPVEYCVQPEHYEQLEALRRQGFLLMADGLPEQGRFLPDAVTSMVVDASLAALPQVHDYLQSFMGTSLVENVTDRRQLERCKIAGFKWYIGEALPHLLPESVPGDTITRTRLMNLLDLVVRDANTFDIEAQLREDPVLSYQLLKLVGSAALGIKMEVQSLHQALNMLGRRQLQRWLQLLLYVHTTKDGGPSPLLFRVAVRAGMMESMLELQGAERDDQDIGFLVGMFSLLDSLLGMPMEQVLQSLTLSEAVRDALLRREGSLGKLLNLAEAAEYSRLPLKHHALHEAGITPEVYCQSLMKSYGWATKISQGV